MDDKQVLFTVKNRHGALLAGAPVTDDGKYVGYFVNEHGEQWIFVFDYGTGEATLAGGDVDWKEYPVGGDDVPDTGGLILGQREALWLLACWEATRVAREKLAKAERDTD